MSLDPSPPLSLASPRTPPPAAATAPAAEPLWLVPENAGRRSSLVILLLLTLIGLYAWTLSMYYAGAQGGVDQSGYLMTARLIAGDKNIYSAAAPAPIPASLKSPAASPENAAADHPAPSAAQTLPLFNFIRNRLSFVPESPFQFASRMCIYTEPYGPPDTTPPLKPATYRVYAKYPFGYPLMAAIGRLIFGFDGMYIINPLCTVLACWFAFFLFRQVVSPFMSMLGVIWLACNPVVLVFANDANSHSSTLLFTVAGFWALISWMQTRQTWRAWFAGLALGYACTIRYTEFLLVLPVLFAAAVNFRWNRKRAIGSLSLLAGWAIPVAVLAVVCWISFGAPWKTGYTYCRESTGFAWKYLSGDWGDAVVRRQGNWETLLQQLNHTGLFLFWPIALAGLIAMMGSTWRLGITVALWVLPQMLLYMLYYWAPAGENTVGYLRFFMTIVPGMILAGLWVLERGLLHLHGEKRTALIIVTAFGLLVLVAAALYVDGEPLRGGFPLLGQVFTALWRLLTISVIGFMGTILYVGLIAGIWLVDHQHAATKVGMALSAGVITALGCAMNLYNILPHVEGAYTQCMAMRQTVNITRALLPKGSVLFSDDQTLNQLDCVGDWKLFNAQLFTQVPFNDARRRLENLDQDKDNQDDPNPVQPERSRFIMELLGRQNPSGSWVAKPFADFTQYQNNLIDENFAQGRRVAFLVSERLERGGRPGRPMLPVRRDCDVKELGRWVSLPPVSVQPVQVGRFGAGPRNPMRPPPAPPNRFAQSYVLYELVRKQPPAPPKPPPVKGPAETAKPVPPPAVPSTQKSIFDF